MPARLNNLANMKTQIAGSGRWVLLRHSVPETFRRTSGRGDHFDLLLEPAVDSMLWTWAIDQNIFQKDRIAAECSAKRLPNHRSVYLNFEGPVSGNRGIVKPVFAGTYVTLESATGLTLSIKTNLDSPFQIAGELVLIQVAGDDWRLEFKVSP